MAETKSASIVVPEKNETQQTAQNKNRNPRNNNRRKSSGKPLQEGALAQNSVAKTPVLEEKKSGNLPKPAQNNQNAGSKNTNGQKRRPSQNRKPKNQSAKPTVKIMALGGLNEIGKNMMLFECQDDIIILDCGLAFPDEEMFGVDIVIPDFTFVERNKEKFKALVVTHGHEDHIGAIAYLFKIINIPIYGTRMTLGLIEGKLKEHNLLSGTKLMEVTPGQSIKLGCMSAEFISVNHSIPGACAIAITTPAGVIVHTGDFKVDYTPVEGPVINLARFGELGNQGVLALISDSTNSEREGATRSERIVGEAYNKLFKTAADKRIIIATFSSNVHRLQQVIDACVAHGRKLAISGRSMVNVFAKAQELGYLVAPEGLVVDVDNLNQYADNQIVLATTGSQGEPMSALSRMSMREHRKVKITPNDFIIISATPIPGNEKTVSRVIDELMKLGATVIYEKSYNIHVSGHASQEEQKLMLSLIKPKFFIPAHGEFHHLKRHAQTAQEMGVEEKNIFAGQNGMVLETNGVEMKFTTTVPSGSVMVDGLGVGDVGSIVLRDRKHLGQDGIIIVAIAIERETGQIVGGPDIVSRGFVYVREAEEIIAESKKVCRQVLEGFGTTGAHEWASIKSSIKERLSGYIYSATKRSPMILPIIQDV